MSRVAAMCVTFLVLLAAGMAQAAPTVRTAGYKGVTKAVRTAAPTAPPAVEIGTGGSRPDIVVDAAGTAHIVWNEDHQGSADATVYCRVPRGAAACEALHRLVPPGAGEYSDGGDGPAVAAVNDQVVVLSYRYPESVPKPDGATTPNTVYMWTSDDAGESFTSPAVVASGTGPGAAVAGGVAGGAVAFGPPESPSVATVTDIVTGGVTVTTIQAGRYVPLGASVAVGDYVNGRLAVVDGRPAVVYQDLGNTSYVRRWSGQGDPNDVGTWEPAQAIPGRDPAITNAGGRLVVGVTDPAPGAGELRLYDLTAGGAPTVVNPGGRAGGQRQLIGHPDGSITVMWQGASPGGDGGLWTRTVAANGRPIASPVLVVSGTEPLFSRAGAAPDGGGIVVSDTADRRILLGAFGTRAPIGRPGLGSRPGGGALPPDAAVDCQRVRFGVVEALLQDGCFLNAATGRAKVSVGPLRLNGLEIVPEPGVQILIDARKRTIDTTGTVRVLLRAPGVPEIVLYRGSLHLQLSGAGGGTSLFAFAKGVFRPNILGFAVAGDVDVRLTDRGVRIPISLALPAVFGGVQGAVELRADNGRGLVIDSLEFRADGVPLGPATMRRLHVQYKAQGGTSVGDCLRPATSGASAQPNEWAGVFDLQLPPPQAGPALCGSIRFGGGAFRAATFNIDLPFPGIVLFPGVSVVSLGGGLALQPVTELTVTTRIGVIPTGGTALVNLDGRLSARFGDPFVMRGDVDMSVATVKVGHGGFVIASDGYVSLNLAAGPEIGPLAVRAAIAGFVDGPREQFSLSGTGEICLKGACLPGGSAAVSTKGVAACLPVPAIPRGAGYTWGQPIIGGLEIWPFRCNTGRYVVADARAAAQGEHAGGVGEAVVAVSGRPAAVTFRVAGDGAMPDVELVGPTGAVVVPANVYADAETGTLYLDVAAPAAGTWRARAKPGTAPILQLAAAPAVTFAKVTRASVAGKGRTRVLTYRANIAAGQGITFVERGRAGSRVLGRAVAGKRRLGFRPGPGPGGRRKIVAMVLQDGLVRSESVVARYQAPPPPRVGKASRLRVRRAGGRAVVSWRPAIGAAVQRVTVTVGDGRSIVRQVPRSLRRLAVPGIVRGDRVTVRVVALAADGRRGATSRVSARIR